MTRPGHGPRRRRMKRGTIVRTGGLAVRQGRQRSQLARIDCTSSRRSTVMCALSRATAITTEYQRDSSSKRPRSSVVFAAREPGPRLRKLPVWWTLNTASTTPWKTRSVFHSYRSPPASIDKRSFHISASPREEPEPDAKPRRVPGLRSPAREPLGRPAVDSESRFLI
jgi:hypothetical protein